MSCKFCGRAFNRGFNLRRHEKEYCPLKDRLENMSQTELSSQEMDSQDDVSTNSTDRSESSMATDNESEAEEQMDPWIPMIEEAKRRSNVAFEEMKESLINRGLDEQSAGNQAYSNILPKLQKELENIYMERLLWMKQLKKDPVHKKIMHTKEALVEKDDFDAEEALEAAVDMRKFLIRRLLRGYDFDEENNDDDDNDDDDDDNDD